MRRSIADAGGEVLFGAKVTGVQIKDDRICGVWLGDTLVEGAAVILAAGHSARDIYEMLDRDGVRLEAKAFAMGVRAEHPQRLIDSIQYHMPERGEYLPAAAYSLVRAGGRTRGLFVLYVSRRVYRSGDDTLRRVGSQRDVPVGS